MVVSTPVAARFGLWNLFESAGGGLLHPVRQRPSTEASKRIVVARTMLLPFPINKFNFLIRLRRSY
jgi:hypothetical protein